MTLRPRTPAFWNQVRIRSWEAVADNNGDEILRVVGLCQFYKPMMMVAKRMHIVQVTTIFLIRDFLANVWRLVSRKVCHSWATSIASMYLHSEKCRRHHQVSFAGVTENDRVENTEPSPVPEYSNLPLADKVENPETSEGCFRISPFSGLTEKVWSFCGVLGTH